MTDDPGRGQPPYGQRPYPDGPYGAPQGPHPYGRPGQLSPQDERTWGMVAHLSGLVAAWLALGFIGPLVVMLIQGPKSAFVRSHAVEALNFQILLLIGTVVLGVVTVVTFGLGALLFIPFGIVALVLIILAAVKANNGEPYAYPLNLHLVK